MAYSHTEIEELLQDVKAHGIDYTFTINAVDVIRQLLDEVKALDQTISELKDPGHTPVYRCSYCGTKSLGFECILSCNHLNRP